MRDTRILSARPRPSAASGRSARGGDDTGAITWRLGVGCARGRGRRDNGARTDRCNRQPMPCRRRSRRDRRGRQTALRGVAISARSCSSVRRRAPISRSPMAVRISATVRPARRARRRSSALRPGKRVTAPPIASGRWASLPPVSARCQRRALSRRTRALARRARCAGLANSTASRWRPSRRSVPRQSIARRPMLGGSTLRGCGTTHRPAPARAPLPA